LFKLNNIILNIIIISILLIISGCGGSKVTSKYNENSANYTKNKKSISINNTKKVYYLGKSLNSKIKLQIENKKDIYVVVTSNFFDQKISITSSVSSRNIEKKSYKLLNSIEDNKSINISKYRENIINLLHKNLAKNSTKIRQLSKSYRTIDTMALNQTQSFCIGMDNSNNCTIRINATAKKIIKNVQTPYGVKSLVIWLESGNGGVSQRDIDNLANIFLKGGGNNDIYDWVTNLYGSEWGDNAKNVNGNLIAKSNIIDILLYNMNNSGLAGYFWGKDNFKKSAIGASNEKIMFYINTQLLSANPKETYTTLAHEFQHMIHFYQRAVLKKLRDSTWFDELMSETTEDLVATKIGYMGPRNVDPNNGTAGRAGNRGGRYPNFNRYNTASLIIWNNSTVDYSKVSAFGGFLARNYDGAKLLHKLMTSRYTDQRAILDATGESSFNTLINKWGCAVVLSDKIGLNNKLEYNFGDFRYTGFGNTIYELGSVNFFNYIPQPQFTSNAILAKSANLYYRVGTNLSGVVNLNINIPKGADISIIAK